MKCGFACLLFPSRQQLTLVPLVTEFWCTLIFFSNCSHAWMWWRRFRNTIYLIHHLTLKALTHVLRLLPSSSFQSGKLFELNFIIFYCQKYSIVSTPYRLISFPRYVCILRNLNSHHIIIYTKSYMNWNAYKYPGQFISKSIFNHRIIPFIHFLHKFSISIEFAKIIVCNLDIDF